MGGYMGGIDFSAIQNAATQGAVGSVGGAGTAMTTLAQQRAAMGLDPLGRPLSASGTSTASKSPAQVIQDIIQNGTAAIPQSIKDLTKQTTNTSTSQSQVGTNVQDASDATADAIKSMVQGGVPDYTGDRVAQLSGQEKDSADFISNLMKGGGAGTAAMQGSLKDTDTSGITKSAGPVDTQKLTDVDISKYMNPALTAEYDAILHGNDVMNNATRARMAKAGAFGANMQVAQAQNNESTQRQLALAGSDAFRTAQGAAQGDVSAENAGRQANRTAAMGAAGQAAGINLSDKQRQLTGGSMMNQDALTTANANAASGATARGVEQAGNDAKWQQYLTKLGLTPQILSSAAGALSGLPTDRTLTQSQLGASPDGQAMGALIGLTGIQNQYGTGSNRPMSVSGIGG